MVRLSELNRPRRIGVVKYPACFPGDDTRPGVSWGQLGSLHNSGFANIRSSRYLQFNRSDLPPGSYSHTSNIVAGAWQR